VELDVEDVSQLDQMCEQLLTNPLIEDYEIQLQEPSLDRPDAGRPDQDAGLDALRR
jgi:Phosphoribosylformylglycinamidine (FGAM) synthase